MAIGTKRSSGKRRWAIAGGVVVAGFIAVGALGDTGSDGEKPEPVAAPALVDLASSAESADAAVGEPGLGFLSRSQFVAIVEGTCTSMSEGDTTPEVANRVIESLGGQVKTLTGTQVRSAADRLATVIPQACPDNVADHPTLISEIVGLAPIVTTTTTSTTSTTTSTTTTTTAPPRTVPPTTAPPATTPPTTAAPVAAPPPPPPPLPPPPPPPPSSGGASYANCSAARAAGVTPLYRGQPGYAAKLDGDDDGVACE